MEVKTNINYYKNSLFNSEKLKDDLFLRSNNHLEGWHNKYEVKCKYPKPIKKKITKDTNEQHIKEDSVLIKTKIIVKSEFM